jgi:hypothetical protein
VSCAHENFQASVCVGRLLDDKTETRVIGYTAEIKIHCATCKKEFQFLGLEPGVDTHGARVSIDGLKARIAICPAGERPNPLQRLQFSITAFDG